MTENESSIGATTPPPPPPNYAAPQFVVPAEPPWWAKPPKKKRLFGRVLLGLLAMAFLVSVVINLYLLAFLAVQMEGPLKKRVVDEGKADQVIAVYTIDGIITGRTAGAFASFCSEVRDDANVKAVVIRVNSPGGAVAPADPIHASLVKLMIGWKKKAGKKVVVSMGGVAASGGYYVCAAADEIVAEPTTITGSIGVLGQWVLLKGTLEKIGAEPIVMRSTRARGWKDAISPFRPPDDRQRAHLQKTLDDIQEIFEQVVKDGRGDRLKVRRNSYTMRVGTGENQREIEQVDEEPFNGKTYGTDEAIALGLVDRKGYLDAAIDRAGDLAGLSEPKVITYTQRPGLLQTLLQAKTSGSLTVGRELLDDLQTPKIMLLWKVE